MRRYVVLDVHLRSTTIAVVAANGKRIKTFVVETNGQALLEAIRGRRVAARQNPKREERQARRVEARGGAEDGRCLRM